MRGVHRSRRVTISRCASAKAVTCVPDGRIDMQEDGSFQVNLESRKPSYFAYVSLLDGGFANVSWNGVQKYSKASELLGEDFRRKGGCWIGKKGKVCAFKR